MPTSALIRVVPPLGLVGAALALLWLGAPHGLVAITLIFALIALAWSLRSRGDEVLAALAFDTSSNGILISDADNRILMVNPAFTAITGYTAEEVIGKNPRMLSSGRHDLQFYETLWQAVKSGGMWQGEIWNRHKNGEVYAEWLTINAVKNARGEVTHHVGVFSDITERKTRAERLEYRATHDALTGLPNRVMFDELLDKALAHARRAQNKIAVLFLDLDRFKQVNDTLGHDVGDLLLQNVAQTLTDLLRAGDIVARQGGDEFTMALPNLANREDARLLAAKILRAMEQPCTLQGQRLQVTISIGIALFPDDGVEPFTLLKHADLALYRAKAAGRNNVQFFDPAMEASPACVAPR